MHLNILFGGQERFLVFQEGLRRNPELLSDGHRAAIEILDFSDQDQKMRFLDKVAHYQFAAEGDFHKKPGEDQPETGDHHVQGADSPEGLGVGGVEQEEFIGSESESESEFGFGFGGELKHDQDQGVPAQSGHIWLDFQHSEGGGSPSRGSETRVWPDRGREQIQQGRTGEEDRVFNGGGRRGADADPGGGVQPLLFGADVGRDESFALEGSGSAAEERDFGGFALFGAVSAGEEAAL
ncbi:hypothetical protein OJ252_908 [Cryptosporidium canis]|uniref:Uncharacterized protein n=1 Tax=Cryptosporidium canis TaxID=195482 RepID=A0ABQ8P9N3_9CRYT|nr:hypothetical protein OJ252_908 [Cryptosporidium canis]